MELRVIGCHGGESPRHRTCAFLVDETLAIDAGSLTRGMDLSAQARLEACLVSHAHLDHVRDLATLADNRCQMQCPPLLVAGTRETLSALRRHLFNGVMWPDFSQIPSGTGCTIQYVELEPDQPVQIAGKTIRASFVSHSVESVAFVVESGSGSIGYSGDTGPPTHLWEVLNKQPDLRALLMEVSFPNRHQDLATASGHHTPQTLAADLQKLDRCLEVPTLLYHIKPVFQAEVERECAALHGLNLDVLALDDHLVV